MNVDRLNWVRFRQSEGQNQLLPDEKKWVVVRIRSTDASLPDPLACGHLKYAARDRSCPYFVIPGLGGEVTDWCDCLPRDFGYPRLTMDSTSPFRDLAEIVIKELSQPGGGTCPRCSRKGGTYGTNCLIRRAIDRCKESMNKPAEGEYD